MSQWSVTKDQGKTDTNTFSHKTKRSHRPCSKGWWQICTQRGSGWLYPSSDESTGASVSMIWRFAETPQSRCTWQEQKRRFSRDHNSDHSLHEQLRDDHRYGTHGHFEFSQFLYFPLSFFRGQFTMGWNRNFVRFVQNVRDQFSRFISLIICEKSNFNGDKKFLKKKLIEYFCKRSIV